MKWLLVLLAVLYALFPFDLLPDMVAGLGWLDDLILAVLVGYWFFRRPHKTPPQAGPQDRSHTEDHRQQGRRQRSHSGKGPEAPPGGQVDPYGVLGLERGADPAEVRAAYRRLAAQYHPDKVAHLGEEFQRLAEHRFKAIQAAYDQLRPRA